MHSATKAAAACTAACGTLPLQDAPHQHRGKNIPRAVEHPRLQRCLDRIALAAAGCAHAAYVPPAAEARHPRDDHLRRNAGQPGRLSRRLLSTAHAGQRVAQQQRSLGHIGHDQISVAAQVVHGGDHIRPQTAVQPAAVPQHGVHDLEGAGPQRKAPAAPAFACAASAR